MSVEKNLKSRNMMKFFIVMAMLLGSSVASAENKQITSPDGKLVVTVSDMNGRPSYSVSYDNVLFLKPSPLGIIANIGDFSSGMSLEKNVSTNKIDETYELASIKKSKVHYVANEAVFSFTQQGKTIYDVIFRISNNDVAFKYKMYPQGETLSCVVKQEVTGFAFPDGTTTFLCPQSKPMGGFARTSPSYETSYTADDVAGKNGWGEGYTFPCLFRNGDNGWTLVSETGVNGGYCASRLLGHKEGVYTIGFPQEGEANGNGTVSPGIALPGETPWRTITVGKTLAPIVETTVPFDVVKPLYPAKGEYTYGAKVLPTVIVRQGVSPGNAIPRETVPFPFASPSCGNPIVYVPPLCPNRRLAQYPPFTPVSETSTQPLSPLRNRQGNVYPSPQPFFPAASSAV